MDLAAIAQQCEGAHQDKQGWRAKCPVHHGKSDTSLHIWEESGNLRIYCHAGCNIATILEYFNLTKTRTESQPERIYSYHDENGNVSFQVCRTGKKFYQRRPHPSKPGTWINDLKGVTRILYHLPEVLRAIEAGLLVYLVEGEKDVETLRAHGLAATCNPMGAGKWADNYSQALKGARIILLPDNDKPGKDHAAMVMTRLTGYVHKLTRIDLPGLSEGGDVSDFLQDHPIEELQALVDASTPQIDSPHLVLESLFNIEREEIEWLWEPYIPIGKLTFLEGDPGNGKTFLALALATAFSQGYALPDQQGKVDDTRDTPKNSMYITAEDGLGDTIRPRAEDMGADLQRIFAVKGWTAGQDLQMFNFQQVGLLEEAIRDREIKLIIIDPIDAFLGGDVDMYRPNEVRPIMSQLHLIASKTRCSIVFIRHWTKSAGGNARYRGLGSIAFTAAVRSQIVVGEALDDETKRIMAHAKTNIGPLGKSQVFSINDGIFGWYGLADIDANELAQQQPRKRQHQIRAAVDWLKDFLKNGPVSSQTILDTAESMGISERSIRRAKSSMGILSEKQGPTWYWKLSKRYDDDIPF